MIAEEVAKRRTTHLESDLMKRMIAAFLSASLVSAFAGCDSGANTATVPDNPAPMPTAPAAEVSADQAGAGETAAPTGPAAAP